MKLTPPADASTSDPAEPGVIRGLITQCWAHLDQPQASFSGSMRRVRSSERHVCFELRLKHKEMDDKIFI